MQAVEAVEIEIGRERRPHDAALASYLDKLLRQPPQPPEPVQPPEVQEARRSDLSTDWQEDSHGDRSWPSEPGQAAVAPQRTSWSRAVPRKRAKSAAPRRIRTKSRRSQARPKGARQVVMTALIPILAVALVVLLRRSIGGPGATRAETPAVKTPTPVMTASTDIDWQVPEVLAFTGPDPMRPEPPEQPVPEQTPEAASTAASLPRELEVRGVLYSEDRPAALIGTRLVHEGEQVGGATVIAIDRDGVELERNGERWRLVVSTSSGSRGPQTTQGPEDGP